jgi:hypothetical protein
MGHFIKTSTDNNKSIDTVILTADSKSFTKDNEAKLYKPIEQFSWRDATKREVKEEAISAYKKFAF